MTGTICSVTSCKSNSRQAKESGEQISFFNFPKNKKLRKEWVRRCHRKDTFNAENKRICSKHFVLDDFEDLVQARLLSTYPKKLKSTAVPTVNIHGTKPLPKSTARSKRMEIKENKRTVQKLVTDSGTCSISETPDGISDVPLLSESNLEPSELVLERKISALLQQNESLKEVVEKQKEEILHLQQHIISLEMSNKEWKGKCDLKIKELFDGFLTQHQLDILLKKKTKVRWSQEEISKALTLRYFSKRAYIYVRNKLNYPLPGISTLQSWASNINLRNGLLTDVLRIMEISGKSKSALQRVAVMSFDEVKVASLYEYDQKADETVGPHSQMQVVMIRGLFDKWKQPIYIGFDHQINKSLFDKIVLKLHAINYSVVACVSDCGTGNQGLWKNLQIDVNQTFYVHPETQGRIYFFADTPHILKLIRNWLRDTGFELEDGTLITIDPVRSLVESTGSEISSCHKLTTLHIDCQKTQRQKVSLAAQLLSHTTATALKVYQPGIDKKHAYNVGNFIELISQWFDIMNSYTPVASVPTKNPYGKNLDIQKNVLDECIKMFGTMRCLHKTKTSLQVFQKGLIISSKSIHELYEYTKEKYGISYILTHRLNQDCLENFFSQLRTRGGLHDHPSPLNAIYRIRMILVGKNPGIVQQQTNILQNKAIEEDGDYVVASALKSANISVTIPDACTLGEDFPDNISSTSSGSSGNESHQTVAEKDGLLYLAGFLARKFSKEYPDLGSYTHKLESLFLHTYSIPSWVQCLSFGGLTQPSNKWMEEVNAMEKYFQKFNKDTFHKNRKKIVQRTCEYIVMKLPNIPKPLVQAFSRLRIMLRIKYLNLKKHGPLKRKAEATSSKIAKKMKKIVN